MLLNRTPNPNNFLNPYIKSQKDMHLEIKLHDEKSSTVKIQSANRDLNSSPQSQQNQNLVEWRHTTSIRKVMLEETAIHQF